MRLYHIIGQNIETSLSPRIHNCLLALKGRKPTYQPGRSGWLPSVGEMLEERFGGATITIPFKKHYAKSGLIRRVGRLSSEYGIMNTIYKQEERQLYATNTDIYGIEQTWNSSKGEVEHKNAIVLGAGATSLTFVHFLSTIGFRVTLLNRSTFRLQGLQNYFSNIDEMCSFDNSKLETGGKQYGVVINTLPTSGVEQHLPQLHQWLNRLFQAHPRDTPTQMIYFDVNYRARQDLCLQMLRGYSFLRVLPLRGIDMLVWQAVEQNRLFLNEPPLDPQQARWQYHRVAQQLML